MKVYAVVGVPPEVQAYAMAKYSRSSKSMLDSIRELSAQRAEEFLNTFYFQYGHRSIADLAHLALAVEDVSILAAVRVVDEQLWDGQERSTRYQPFKKTGYFTPPELDEPALGRYRAAADALFAAYDDLTKRLLALLVERVPRPADLDAKAFERTLRARAFDVSRALLPLATITSLGQVVNARVLERQISRLLSDPLPEAREIGAALRRACLEPAARVGRADANSEDDAGAASGAHVPAVPSEAVAALNGQEGAHRTAGQSGHAAHGHAANGRANGHAPERHAANGHGDEVRVAPTLVKYTAPSEYAIKSREILTRLAAELLAGAGEPDRDAVVELADDETPRDEAVATLLYRHDPAGHSYRQVQAVVRAMPDATKRRVLEAAVEHRGRHDELPRELQSGYAFKFDILMDFGSFRDLHRHRRCVQIVQDPTPDHGVEPASEVFPGALGDEIADAALAAGLGAAYDDALAAGLAAARELEQAALLAAPYLLPLATRTRAMFKMDAAQAVYMAELRTAPAGHFSYRRVAWDMHCAFAARAPELAALGHPTDPSAVFDLLHR